MENTGKIYEKMAAIMKAVKPIGKDRNNAQQNFKFRGIDDVMNELHEAFAANDVFITTDVISREETERVSKTGGALFYVKCTCKFTLHTTDGSSISSITIGEGMDSGDKGTNKAMSIALKYALLQMFLIPTEESKDPDAESHEVKPKTAAVKPQTTTAPKAPTTDDGKAWITDKQVASAISRINAGESGIIENCRERYKISKANYDKLIEAKKAYDAMPVTAAEEVPELPSEASIDPNDLPF